MSFPLKYYCKCWEEHEPFKPIYNQAIACLFKIESEKLGDVPYVASLQLSARGNFWLKKKKEEKKEEVRTVKRWGRWKSHLKPKAQMSVYFIFINMPWSLYIRDQYNKISVSGIETVNKFARIASVYKYKGSIFA